MELSFFDDSKKSFVYCGQIAKNQDYSVDYFEDGDGCRVI